MYSYKERMKAVRFYINSNFRIRYTLRTLGYPSSRVTLCKWYKEYCEKHKLSKKHKRKPKFSKEMINKAIKHYYENGRNKAFTVKQLGYPCKYTLHIWLQKYSKEYTYRKVNSSKKFEAEQKVAIVKDIVCNHKKAVTKFAKEYNVSRTSLYNWSKSLLGTANMRKKKTNDKNTMNLSEAELKNQELMQQIEQLKKKTIILQ